MAQQFVLAEAFVDIKPRGVTALAGSLSRVRRAAEATAAGLFKMASIFKRLVLTAAKFAAIGGAAITAVGVAILKVASDAHEMSTMFDEVFKGGSEEARKFAVVLSRHVGRGVVDIMGAMAEFQDTFVPLGFARDKAALLSKAMVKLSIDVGSFKNKTTAEAIDRFGSAMVGNHRAVRLLGIVLTETSVKQKMMEMGFNSTTHEATEQMRVIARLKIMFDSTKDAQDDAARTIGSLANQWQRFKGILKDTTAALGAKFLPTAAKALKTFGDFATRMFNLFQKDSQRAWAVVVSGVNVALSHMKVAFLEFFSWLIAETQKSALTVAKQLVDFLPGPVEKKVANLILGSVKAGGGGKPLSGDIQSARANAKAMVDQFKMLLGPIGVLGGGEDIKPPDIQALFDEAVKNAILKPVKQKKGGAATEPGFEFHSFSGFANALQKALGQKDKDKEQIEAIEKVEGAVNGVEIAVNKIADRPALRWA